MGLLRPQEMMEHIQRQDHVEIGPLPKFHDRLGDHCEASVRGFSQALQEVGVLGVVFCGITVETLGLELVTEVAPMRADVQ